MKIGGSRQFKKRETADAIDNDVVFIASKEFVLPFIVLVGCSMDAQFAVKITVGWGIPVESATLEGFWIVLCRVCRNGRGINCDNGSVYDAKLEKVLHLRFHEVFRQTVVKGFDESIKGMITRRRIADVKAAVLGDE